MEKVAHAEESNGDSETQSESSESPHSSTHNLKRLRDSENDFPSRQEEEEVDAEEGGTTKRTKIEEKTDAEHHGVTSNGVSNESMDTGDASEKEDTTEAKQAPQPNIMSSVVTRARASDRAITTTTESSGSAPLLEDAPVTPERNGEDTEAHAAAPSEGPKSTKRWRVHQMAEDYVELVGNMMYPGTNLSPYGFDPSQREYPLGGVSSLGYLKSPIRRHTVIERWSPYEIALFEAALLHHGKDFHAISKMLDTKPTKEIIDFYYIWKKTSHYKKWKKQYVPPAELVDVESPVKGPKL